MSVVQWVNPRDCHPPHGLDLNSERDLWKVTSLAESFTSDGFDRSKSALVGYPLDGEIQLLSGTHRHQAAIWARILLPVTLWLRSDIEKIWGDLEELVKVMRDIPVSALETWTREDLEHMQTRKAG